jgi:hypothetical protein
MLLTSLNRATRSGLTPLLTIPRRHLGEDVRAALLLASPLRHELRKARLHLGAGLPRDSTTERHLALLALLGRRHLSLHHLCLLDRGESLRGHALHRHLWHRHRALRPGVLLSLLGHQRARLDHALRGHTRLLGLHRHARLHWHLTGLLGLAALLVAPRLRDATRRSDCFADVVARGFDLLRGKEH